MAGTQDDSISTEERSARERAVAYARASVALEGLRPSAADEERARRFINGELSVAEYVDPADLLTGREPSGRGE
jgi:Antitoxin VbhA